MAHYIRLGRIPRKRHTQFRQPDGSLYTEELFGVEGFSGPSSLLYHAHPPTQAAGFAPLGDLRPERIEDAELRHRHLRTAALPAQGDPITGRIPLLVNDDVSVGLVQPVAPMDYFYKNADGDDLLFVHRGAGRLETLFGTLSYGPGDYLVVPRGTIYRVVADPGETTMLHVETAASPIVPPRRYRSEFGQLLEHAPYCERDIRLPGEPLFYDQAGRFEVRIKARGRLWSYVYDFHPLDVVGWDGFVYPWALSIHDFEPITGSLHQPPPVHQTFAARGFVVCSFVPRLLDYHPDAVPAPYAHSNVDSDELLYYANGQFASRRGIEEGSMTLHPLGLPHGPQPGAVEASLGKVRTEELAVMVDTFRPLRITRASLALDDPSYPRSWNPAG